MRFTCACLGVLLSLVGCGTPSSEATPVSVSLAGAVQKGPFVLGSTIQVSTLDWKLAPTGMVFNTQTKNDLGEFQVSFTTTGPVSLEGNGFYYNEVTGELSSAPLTLRALFVPIQLKTNSGNGEIVGSGDGRKDAGDNAVVTSPPAHVNVITHLTYERVKSLVGADMGFEAATKQAEGELFNELRVTATGFFPSLLAIDMNIAGADTEDNAYLLAVSSVVVQMAVLRGGPVDARVQELCNEISLGFIDGKLPERVQPELTKALLTLNVADIQAKLAKRMRETQGATPMMLTPQDDTRGSDRAVPNMARILDQDRDGIANNSDNCPTVANADQANEDGDSMGDACDSCPKTTCEYQCDPASAVPWGYDTCYKPCSAASVTADGQPVTGGVDSACSANEVCLPSARCTTGKCCLPYGGLHQPCLPPKYECNDPSLVCNQLPTNGKYYTEQECAPGRKEGESCDAVSQRCVGETLPVKPLICWSFGGDTETKCYRVGSEGAACRPKGFSMPCDSGLTCVTEGCAQDLPHCCVREG